MLAFPGPRSKDKPLYDAVMQSITAVPTTSIPRFVEKGLTYLFEDAAELRAELNIEEESETPDDKDH